jgi:hypothetical protein
MEIKPIAKLLVVKTQVGGLILISLLTKPTEAERDASSRVQKLAFEASPVRISRSDYAILAVGLVASAAVFVGLLFMLGILG